MILYLFARIAISGIDAQLDRPPHPDGAMLGAKASVSVDCPRAGRYAISFVSNARGRARVARIVSEGKPVGRAARDQVTSWIINEGFFNHAIIQCYDKSASVLIEINTRDDRGPFIREIGFTIRGGIVSQMYKRRSN